MLTQREHQTIPAAEQIAILHAVNNGLFDALPVADVPDAEQRVCRAVRESDSDLRMRIDRSEALDSAAWHTLFAAARAALQQS